MVVKDAAIASLYIESPAFVYEIYKEELRRGTLRGMTE